MASTGHSYRICIIIQFLFNEDYGIVWEIWVETEGHVKDYHTMCATLVLFSFTALQVGLPSGNSFQADIGEDATVNISAGSLTSSTGVCAGVHGMLCVLYVDMWMLPQL